MHECGGRGVYIHHAALTDLTKFYHDSQVLTFSAGTSNHLDDDAPVPPLSFSLNCRPPTPSCKIKVKKPLMYHNIHTYAGESQTDMYIKEAGRGRNQQAL